MLAVDGPGSLHLCDLSIYLLFPRNEAKTAMLNAVAGLPVDCLDLGYTFSTSGFLYRQFQVPSATGE